MSLPDAYRGNALTELAEPTSYPGAPIERRQDRIDLRLLMSIFQRRRELVLACLLGGALLALIYSFAQPQLYLASADVVMNKRQADLVPGTSAQQDLSPIRSEEIETELKVIRSRTMAEETVKSLGLANDKEFAASIDAEPVRQNTGDLLATKLLSSLKAERIENAYAIRISYTDTDPERAAAIANGVADNYASRAVNVDRAASEKNLKLLSEKIEALRAQAQSDFGAVQAFRISNGLLSAEATSLAEQETAAYGQQLAAARSQAAEDQGKSGSAQGAGVQAVALASPVLNSLRSQRATLSVKVAELSGRYLDGHPELTLARTSLADIDSQIAVEESRVMSGVSTGLAASASASSVRANMLEANLNAARSRLAHNNAALVGLDDLNRKAQASQQLYESYLARYKEILAKSGSEQADARVMTLARAPERPFSPNALLNLALGLVVGFLAGAGAAIAAESAFSGLTTSQDVETRLGVRYLASIPLLSSVDLRGMEPENAIIDVPGSAFTESIRGLIASARQTGKGHSQVVAITSALPGEGKTSIAAALARVAALAGERVIVIDCDLVRHHLSDILGCEKARPGLREMVRGETKLGDAMVQDAKSTAQILPVTTQFERSERLLDKGNFHRMIAIMREHFDLIIFDTAPLLAFAETREIVSLADTVVIATLWRKTPDTAVQSALKLLPMHAIGAVGVALNRIDMKKQVRFGEGDATYYYNDFKAYYLDAPKSKAA